MVETPQLDDDIKGNLEDFVTSSLVIPLARRIHEEGFSSEQELTLEELQSLVESLNPEYYLLSSVKLEEVELCLTSGYFMAAAILLHSIIESEVNQVIRLLLYVRGFSHGEITSLQYTNIAPKINVILPLLNNPLPEQIKRWIKKLKDIRNLGTHDKGLPVKGFDIKDTNLEHTKRAKKLFDEIKIEDLREGFDKFRYGIFLASPEIRRASEIANNAKIHGDPIIVWSNGRVESWKRRNDEV